MNYVRISLINTLRHVVDGGNVTNAELDAAIADPPALRDVEQKAWHCLSYWVDDDMRIKDPA